MPLASEFVRRFARLFFALPAMAAGALAASAPAASSPSESAPAATATAPTSAETVKLTPMLVPEWAVGAAADRDIVTPVAITVQDEAATQEARARAAAAVPSIFRFEPYHADQALAELEAAIAESKPVFQRDVAARFGALPLESKVVLEEDFKQFRRDWVEANKLFPPKFQIARSWSSANYDAEAHLELYRAKLRTALNTLHLRGPELDAEALTGPALARLVVRDSPQDTITPEIVAESAVPFDRSLLQTLPKARDDLRESMQREDWPAARFLGGLMRPNTFYEAELTAAARGARVAEVATVTRTFAAGAPIVRAGEAITPATFAALAKLRDIVPAPPVSRTNAGSDGAPEVAAVNDGSGSGPAWLNRAFYIGLPVAIAVLALAVIVLAVRMPRRSAVVVATGEKTPGDSPVVLALRDATVQRLFTQRQELIAGQERSTDQVASLEERIAKLQPQLQTKLRAYETRIKELEEQLARKYDDDADRLRRELARIRLERDAQIARATASES